MGSIVQSYNPSNRPGPPPAPHTPPHPITEPHRHMAALPWPDSDFQPHSRPHSSSHNIGNPCHFLTPHRFAPPPAVTCPNSEAADTVAGTVSTTLLTGTTNQGSSLSPACSTATGYFGAAGITRTCTATGTFATATGTWATTSGTCTLGAPGAGCIIFQVNSASF